MQLNCEDPGQNTWMHRQSWAFTYIMRFLFSLTVQKYRKSYCTIPGVCIGIGVGVGGGGINKNVKALRQSF